MDEYVIVDKMKDEVWYIEKYSIGRNTVNLTGEIEDAEKLTKGEAEYVAEIFGMSVLEYDSEIEE